MNISGFAHNSNALLQTCYSWYFHVKVLSMKMPKKLVRVSPTISKLSIKSKLFAIRRFFFCEWKSAHFVLVNFRESSFA